MNKKAPGRFELLISCLLDRRFNQLSHGALIQLVIGKIKLTTSNCILPNYQGESTICDKGNFLYHTPDSNNLSNLRELNFQILLVIRHSFGGSIVTQN